jgi:hypothetical protein
VASSTRNRVAATTGIVAVVLIVIGFLTSGANPSWSASGSTIAQDYASHHDAGLASVVIVGFGLMALLWFAATLASAFRAANEDRIGSVILAGAVTFVSIFAVTGVIQWTLFYGSAGGDPVLTKALFQMQSLAASLSFLPLALTVAATSIGAGFSKVFPGWYAILSGIAAVLIVIVVGGVAHSGFFSPNGGYVFVGLLGLAVWLIVSSIVLITRATSVPETRQA